MANRELPIHLEARKSLADLVQTSHSTIVAEVAPAQTRSRTVPLIADSFDEDLATYGRYFTDPKALSYTTPALHIHAIERATVLGADGVVLVDGHPLRDTVRHLPTWRPDCMVANFKHRASIELRTTLAVRERSGVKAFIGFNAAWRNYAHWMQECLPKILAWQRYFDQLGQPQLVLPTLEHGSFQIDTIRLLNISPYDIVMIAPAEVTEFEKAFVLEEMDLFSVPSCVAAAAGTLAAKVRDNINPGQSTDGESERIYIHRLVQTRRVATFARLSGVLLKYGFRVVNFEQMPLERQIITMQAARYVLAEHGAGLANILFCRPGATLIELFNPKTIQPAYWSIVSVCNHNYGYVVGSHSPSTLRPEPDWNAYYDIEPERLEAAISAMLEQPSMACGAAIGQR